MYIIATNYNYLPKYQRILIHESLSFRRHTVEWRYLLQADPPDEQKIPVVDALGVTVVLLTCSYRRQEFVRVGYFINNDYTEPEVKENPPAQPQFDKVSIRGMFLYLKRIYLYSIDLSS